MLGFGSREPAPIDEAIAHARRVGEKADNLSAALDRYLSADDPFKALAVDVFEREQERRIYLGPPH